jgi:hypothetical protein
MKTKRILLLCMLPVFIALAFVGLPPPVAQRADRSQQQQGQTLVKT